MRKFNHHLLLTLILVTVVSLLPAAAQVLATVDVGSVPASAGVNVNTNKVFVANQCGNDPTCNSLTGSMSVIDGSTFNVQTVTTTDITPYWVAVNPITNKIYSATCGNTDTSCYSPGNLWVIDGSSLTSQYVAVGIYTSLVAVNSLTNKTYVVNDCGNDTNCDGSNPGTVTVVDGTTLATQTVNVGYFPWGIAVDSAANKIYVVNECGNDGLCQSPGTVTVIDGATLNTQTVNTDFFPIFAAVNPATHQIYVPNNGGTDGSGLTGSVTVIDGSTLQTQQITTGIGVLPDAVAINAVTNTIYVADDCGTDPNCEMGPTISVINGTTLSASMVSACESGTLPSADMEVNEVTNTLYAACQQGTTVTVLDGATNNTSSVTVGNNPFATVVDAPSNRVFVPNVDDDTVSILAGPNAVPLQFVSVTPCRLVDTRHSQAIQGGSSRDFIVPQLGDPDPCNIPASAAAYSLNVTVVPSRPLGYLTIWPTGEDQPYVSTLNSYDGRTKADAAIVPAGYQGAVSVFVTDTTDVILDINGYFVPVVADGGPPTSDFYPLAPCRVVDTRRTDFPTGLGAPSFGNMESRDLPVLANSPCLQNLPQQPLAYSFNVTVVPNPTGHPLGYLTVWPSDQDQPFVSTLNNPTGTVVANAAIVPAAANTGDISVFAYDSTDVVMDINGYFGTPGGTGALSFYPAAPCRAYDSRLDPNGPLQGMTTRTLDIIDSPCASPMNAGAYVFNATVVPPGFLDYITLWPHGEMDQPFASTLNAYDGFVASNMAIVPNLDGSINAYASQITHLIMDISGYYAPLPDGSAKRAQGNLVHRGSPHVAQAGTRRSGKMLPHAQCEKAPHLAKGAPLGCTRRAGGH